MALPPQTQRYGPGSPVPRDPAAVSPQPPSRLQAAATGQPGWGKFGEYLGAFTGYGPDLKQNLRTLGGRLAGAYQLGRGNVDVGSKMLADQYELEAHQQKQAIQNQKMQMAAAELQEMLPGGVNSMQDLRKAHGVFMRHGLIEASEQLIRAAPLFEAPDRKAPTTRQVREGDQIVNQEFDPITGTWKEVGRGAVKVPTQNVNVGGKSERELASELDKDIERIASSRRQSMGKLLEQRDGMGRAIKNFEHGINEDNATSAMTGFRTLVMSVDDSAVREGDQKVYENVLSRMEQIEDAFKKATTGFQRTELARQSMETARSMYEILSRAVEAADKPFRDRARDLGIDWSRIDQGGPDFDASETNAAAVPFDPSVAPVTGQSYVLPNGETAVWNGQAFEVR